MRKERIVLGKVTFLWGKGRGSIMQTTSLMLTGKCLIDWLEVTFPGKTETAIKSWFVVLGASDSFKGLFVYVFFNNLSHSDQSLSLRNVIKI